MNKTNLFTIGEFSKITGLTVKTLRFYHEEGLLAPSAIDDLTGYRFYDAGKIETARMIAELRALEFSLPEITEIVNQCREESDLLEILARHKLQLAAKAQHYRQIEARLDQIIRQQREARAIMNQNVFAVEEKIIETIVIAAVRMKGRYRDCGQGFSQIGRRLGRFINGPCFLLHYNDEYREDDADFEACFPLIAAADGNLASAGNKAEDVNQISIRELPGGKCVALKHQGPYDQLEPAYQIILTYAKEKQYEIALPTREVYLKGPGMIFRGNPKKYLTEIQLMVKS
ncbi:MAG TPA: MerR family transcriptional regulator [Pirellulales bacterium]